MSSFTSRTSCAAFVTLSMFLSGAVNVGSAGAQEQSRDAPVTAAPVVAKQTGSGEITVTWKAVPGATGYIIGRSVWPNGYQRFRPNFPPETRLVDRDITVGVIHRYNVKAVLPNSRVTEAAVSQPLTPTEIAPNPGNSETGPTPGGGTGTPGGGVPGGGGTGTPTPGGTGSTPVGGGTTTPGGTGTPGGATVEKARFRVTIAGFKVLKETYDNPTQVDGQRDEVYLTVGVTGLNPDRKGVNGSAADRRFRTPTYGDIADHSDRIKAGTSHEKGGLRSGDTYRPAPDPKGGTSRLPLRVFDGELARGAPGVAITPVIWEEDLQPSILTDWDSIITSPNWHLRIPLAPFVGQIVGGVVRKITRLAEPVAGMTLAKISSFFDKLWQLIIDRPIGLEMEDGKRVFNPRVLALTYESAQKLLAETNGKPARIEISFEDSDGSTSQTSTEPKGAVNASRLGGRYVLYVDVEKVP